MINIIKILGCPNQSWRISLPRVVILFAFDIRRAKDSWRQQQAGGTTWVIRGTAREADERIDTSRSRYSRPRGEECAESGLADGGYEVKRRGLYGSFVLDDD